MTNLPIDNDGLLYIDINNEESFLKLIMETLPYIHGNWSATAFVRDGVKNPKLHWSGCKNNIPRYFFLDICHSQFGWYAFDDDTPPPNTINIKNEAQLSRLLDQLYTYMDNKKKSLPNKKKSIP